MSKEDTVLANPEPLSPESQSEFLAFVDRCIALGLTSLGAIRELINDEPIISRFGNAESHDPLYGVRTDVELLEQELRAQANWMESQDLSLECGEKENR